jgi:hypothetical protein
MAEHPDRCFCDQQVWQAHLDKLGIAELKVSPDSGADRDWAVGQRQGARLAAPNGNRQR